MSQGERSLSEDIARLYATAASEGRNLSRAERRTLRSMLQPTGISPYQLMHHIVPPQYAGVSMVLPDVGGPYNDISQTPESDALRQEVYGHMIRLGVPVRGPAFADYIHSEFGKYYKDLHPEGIFGFGFPDQEELKGSPLERLGTGGGK